MQYGFVACTSDRFHQVYRETFGNETLTSIRNATVSVSARGGKLDILKWGKESGYDLKNMFNDERTIAGAALNGHLEVVKYLRTLGISWSSDTCSNAAENGHLELLKWARANGCL